MNDALALARTISSHARKQARSHQRGVQLGKVVKVKPLAVELLDGNLVLDEDDLIIPKAVKKRKLKVDEVLALSQVHTHEYMVLTNGATAGSADKGGKEEAEAIEKEEEQEEEAGNTAAILALLQKSGVGLIVHGADENAARESDFGHYIWLGTVTPVNATENDLLAKYE